MGTDRHWSGRRIGIGGIGRAGASIAVAAAIAAGVAQAQERARVLPETRVTASRLGEGVTGASTTVITAEDIERSPAQTLQDLLSTQPGIQVQHHREIQG